MVSAPWAIFVQNDHQFGLASPVPNYVYLNISLSLLVHYFFAYYIPYLIDLIKIQSLQSLNRLVGLLIVSISNKSQFLVISVFSSRNHDGYLWMGTDHISSDISAKLEPRAQDRPTAQVSICWIIQMNPWSRSSGQVSICPRIPMTNWAPILPWCQAPIRQNIPAVSRSMNVWVNRRSKRTRQIWQNWDCWSLWHLEQKLIERNARRCKMM